MYVTDVVIILIIGRFSLVVQEDRKRLQSLASIKASRKDDLKKAETAAQLLRDQLRKAELMCAMKKESLVVVSEEVYMYLFTYNNLSCRYLHTYVRYIVVINFADYCGPESTG